MLKRTPLFDEHVKLGAKMVPFGGFEMPLQYTSIIEEHRWVRQSAGIFDVSHMGEIIIKGPDALEFVSYITSNDPSKLELMEIQYSSFPTEEGTIVDDLLVYRLEDHFMLVVNASNIEKDYNWILSHKKGNVEIINISYEVGEIAFQGPKAEQVLQRIVEEDLSKIKYYWAARVKILGKEVLISRTGYTGEDGFEIYTDNKHVVEIFRKLLEFPEVKPVGLGARDSLRLEMGYCLYGNDIDETTNLIEAGLKWITKLEKPDFIGKDALIEIEQKGITRKRVGFVIKEGGGIPRHGYKIYDETGNEIGFVTSGNLAPSLNIPIGMGYVLKDFAKAGTEIFVEIRGKRVPGEIVKLPFYKEGSVKKA
ncbi:MAG: glycine cleavage system aminomethyltransferase GcvT [bacterium]|nr:glycine cleavage system aminomethyltransferase GcvT [bacterium]